MFRWSIQFGCCEWIKSEEGKKISYLLHSEDDILARAGLYELWTDPELQEGDPSAWVWTCTVLTWPATYSTDTYTTDPR